jgi:hypothetical protein
MHFEELEQTTRDCMLREVDAEDAGGNPYRSRGLSAAGLAAFPGIPRQAIRTGNEVTLIASINRTDFWHPTEVYVRNGVERERQVNVAQAAERLGLTEFNTWYVRGFAKRLLDEGHAECQAYRAAQPKWEHADCSNHEGKIFAVADIYADHRVRYWPVPGDESRLSIPFGPGCHHTIRRVPRN